LGDTILSRRDSPRDGSARTRHAWPLAKKCSTWPYKVSATSLITKVQPDDRMIQEIGIVSPGMSIASSVLPALLHAVEGDGCAVGRSEDA